MTELTKIDTLHGEALAQAADQAVRAIPPAWPLTATVAVNPFLGQVSETLEQTAARLARIGGVRLALPRKHYADKFAKGEIIDEDLDAALQSSALSGSIDLPALKAAATKEPQPVAALPTVADLAARATGKDWTYLVAERIGTFAAGFFDQGQALWAASRRNGLYAAWRAFATHDLTPEIHGLKGFSIHVDETPETPEGVIERVAVSLGLGAEPGTYFHQLLLTLGGWAQFARHLQFKAEIEGRSDSTALELLAIRLVFEEALYARHKMAIEREWLEVRRIHAQPISADHDTLIDGVLQVAAERASQRKLAATLAAPSSVKLAELRPMLQAAFCIDVRSEVFRRALESVDPGVRTLGFAGFFGLGASHKGFASDVAEHRLPVLLKPSVYSCSAVDHDGEADQQARFSARAIRAWGRFKLAAVSSFAFVEAMGPVYAGKLMRDGLGFSKGKKADAAKPRFAPSLDLETRTVVAETVLKAKSLTDGFARFVLIAGHGANVVNNPYASALHCGACGGYAGDVNARLLASLLNDREVREKLVARGFTIPADTVFIGGLHDTTTDTVTLFEDDLENDIAPEDKARICQWLVQAGSLTRAERARRLPRATASSVFDRSRDWSEVRPELGLAGCRAFIAAPRARTAGRSLDGQAFLHDYVWKKDEGFKILELILTAPVVVASWISLQYFGSSVAPSLFGAGNKLLHNVVGGFGVVEGNGGNLRAGLPWQSVHDGEGFVHEPLRLTVAVEAPKEAITDILKRHDQVRALFDNGWLNLFALDEQGQLAWRYAAGQGWTDIRRSTVTHALRVAESA
ncbi:YbcC family protein [Rhizobium helianthi]|uniref:Probable inorganic carbon transporter subunit DabA n=1 Tax=Rhizobium helianthi TaxID=1132695 RepID=A0ABW4M818_9HYPH